MTARLQPKLVATQLALAQSLRGAGRLRDALAAGREAMRLHESGVAQAPESSCDPPASTVGA